MPTLFTLSQADILAVAGLDTADTTFQGYADDVRGDGHFQEALEQRLQPEALSPSRLDVKAGLARLLAAEVLARIAREDPSSQAALQVAGATLGKSPDFAAELRAEAETLLGRYWLRPGAAGISTPDDSPVSPAAQRESFGPGELTRGRDRSR